MSTSTLSDTVTRDIRVVVKPQYEADHSNPEGLRYVFSYHVTISNEGDRQVQLVKRHWIIINGDGDKQEVYGPGVVGFTPTLAPGEEFSYSSYCPLDTEFGTMEGTFQMIDDGSEKFDVRIGRFYLAVNADQ
ncbi:MAG TPA: Co2+/Mg2+ efflux protein ApaG [Bacteroidetes bacterium]|nr:CO2+/MG2+ efflux protein ApaG [bacterium BMS3Bbin04]HDO65171.1 Co2+/Mg2+ efflux protein ApaG [Bacteroidota bacterium]HEX04296.1 Co2+/Mg2+ efflux protein ApaG [Bacteroidota bacterium]